MNLENLVRCACCMRSLSSSLCHSGRCTKSIFAKYKQQQCELLKQMTSKTENDSKLMRIC